MDIPKIEFKDLVIKRASSKKDIDELLDMVRSSNDRKSVVQIFDSRRIAGRMHLIGAYANALIAFNNKTNRTKSKAMEMLLFAAMTDQIEDAIAFAGAKSSSDFVVFANRKGALSKLRAIELDKDFNPTIQSLRKAAEAAGIKAGRKRKHEIEAMVLQKMAVSRL